MKTVGDVSQLAGVTVRAVHDYDEIRELLDDPWHDRASALRRQRALVERELERLGATVVALDEALAAAERGIEQEETTMFKDFDPTEYEDEARERWGHTDAYHESARRTAGYGEAEWSEIRAEAERVAHDFATLMGEGEDAAGERARAVAERHRQHITRWFYPVSAQMHRKLAEMYVADPRFAAGYEDVAGGLSVYVHDAVVANANARGGD